MSQAPLRAAVASCLFGEHGQLLAGVRQEGGGAEGCPLMWVFCPSLNLGNY